MLRTPTRPAEMAFAVTPDDATKFESTRGIYIGGQGDLQVEMADGSIVTFVDLAAGIVHPLAVVRVLEAGTTATGIIALR